MFPYYYYNANKSSSCRLSKIKICEILLNLLRKSRNWIPLAASPRPAQIPISALGVSYKCSTLTHTSERDRERAWNRSQEKKPTNLERTNWGGKVQEFKLQKQLEKLTSYQSLFSYGWFNKVVFKKTLGNNNDPKVIFCKKFKM